MISNSVVCDSYCPACNNLKKHKDTYTCTTYRERVYPSDFDRTKEFEKEPYNGVRYSKRIVC